jgi:ATP-binding cassette subfamily F protein uup
LLSEYTGTLLVVSHDRAFLDNVVTSTLVFEGEGRVGEYIGGYEDWLRQHEAHALQVSSSSPPQKAQSGANSRAKPRANGAKLSYKEKRELESLPATIEQLEAEQTSLQEHISDPTFYQGEHEIVTATLARLDKVARELDRAYSRWEELDSRGG